MAVVRRCDVAVIGAGTAGMEAWRAADGAGADALLIEAGTWGTTCIRVGCIPSKLLLAAADAARRARALDAFGLRAGAVEVDGPAVMRRVRAERDHFLAQILEKVEAIPADKKLEGRARFTGPTRLDVGGDAIEAGRVVIATGSSPRVAPGLRGAGEALVTTDTLFDLADLPRSLAVAGAGAVGIEMAVALARLGVEVAVFDTSPSVAGLHEPDVAARAAALFREEPELHLETEVSAEAAPDGGALVRWKGKAGEGERRFDLLLAAAGRAPNLDGLGLDATGLRLDDQGAPEHDPRTGRGGESAVYIAGDVDGDRPVLHEASFQGGTGGSNAARGGAEPGPKRPAYALAFTDPDCAIVGAPLKSLGEEAVVAVFDEGRGRARIEARPKPYIKLWMRKAGGPIVGGEMVGPQVESVSQLLAQIVAAEMTVGQALALPFYHPTYAEDLKGALERLQAAWREG